jgi:hypothetical protein
VRAEAVLKCSGEGIGHGIGAFPVLGSPDGPVGRAVPGGPERLVAATAAHGCSLISLSAPDGYQAALALAGSVSGIRLAVRAPWTAAGPRQPSHDSVR